MELISILLSNVATRMETFDGKKHLVVPLVVLVEGVLKGLYYPANEVIKYPEAWNGEPVVIDHPKDQNGVEVSANNPLLLEKVKIGQLFNFRAIGSDRIGGEAWIDVSRVEELRPELLQEVHNRLEVSTGLFAESDNIPGTFDGEQYTGTVKNFKPDHLALLPESVGACNWEDGCGVRINMENEVVIPFSERSEAERTTIENFNKKITSEDWQSDYNIGTPHWMESTDPSPLAQEMVDDLRRQEINNAKILEIGVGNGRDSIFMAQSGNDVIGIDIVASAVDSARSKAAGMGGVSFQIGNAESLGFGDATFDAVYSIAALHSTPLRFTLREINRVLKNDGIVKLFLYTATKTGLTWVSYWTPGEIRQFAEEEGFTVLKFREGSNSEPIEIPGVEGLVEQESQQVITTLKKNFVINKKGGSKTMKKEIELPDEVLKAAGIEGEESTVLFKKQLYSFVSNFKANELGHDDIRMQLQSAVDAMDSPGESVQPLLHYVHEVFDDYFIIRQTSSQGAKLFKVGFDVDDDKVVLEDGREEVREQVEFVAADVGLGKQTLYIEVNSKKEDKVMADKCCKELIDALIANEASQFTEDDRAWLDEMPEEQIKKLAPVANEEEDEAVKAAAKKEIETAAVAAHVLAQEEKEKGKKPLTAEEYIESAPKGDMRDSLAAGLTLHKEKKTSIVEGLIANKRNKFTKEQLEAKDIDELENLAELAAVVVDFSLNSAALKTSETDDQPGPMPVVDWKAAADQK